MDSENVRQNTTAETPNVIIFKRVAELMIDKPTITDEEIASHLGVCRQTANRYKNSPETGEVLCQLLSLSEKRVRRLLSKGLDKLEKLMDNPDPKIQIAAITIISKITSPLMTSTFSQASTNFMVNLSPSKSEIHEEWIKDQT